MKVILCILALIVSGCASLRKDVQVLSAQFYLGSSKIIERSSGSFTVECPDTWWLSGNDQDEGEGLALAIVNYDPSPVVAFTRIKNGMRWEEDLAVRSSAIARNTKISASEKLTSYSGFSGNGIRCSGFNSYFGEQHTFILFYPDNQMLGTRIKVYFFGSPNKISLKELDAIVRSTRFSDSILVPNKQPNSERSAAP